MSTTRTERLSTPALSPSGQGVEPFRLPLPSSLPPEQAVLWLREDRRPFALLGDWLGGKSMLGSEPVYELAADRDPFAAVREPPEIATGEAHVGGGWVGWWGYQLGGRIERLPPAPPAPVPRPSFALAYYDHVILFDGERWWFEGLRTAERDRELQVRFEIWERRLRQSPPSAHPGEPTPFALAANGAAGHVAAVAECRRRITAGELLQANICLALAGRFDGDPIDLFARAVASARPRFGALADGVVSLSPERFLRREGRRVWSEPIKGTTPRRGSESEQDAALGELLGSSKDAAEHVMIVDLMRNDLGRVCAYGTVVAEPPRAEPHAGVWHLVSTVSGHLRNGVGDDQLLRAAFPPGSVTGAPKVQAMKLISTLEATRREVYTGAIGIASPIAGLDLSVAIRTFELVGDRIWFGCGGGIVADSDPERELAEALVKASGPIAAISGRLGTVSRNTMPEHPVIEAALRHGQRPDPGLGVFETVLVQDGRPLDMRAHLDRLGRSLRALYGASLPPDTEARVIEAAALAESRSALRILADLDGSIVLTVTAAPQREVPPLLLTPFAIPGGLGSHKWRDRRLLEALSGQRSGTVPLLVDTDGEVLEAAHANVWIAEDQALITPPADGRILPGVTRAALLRSDPCARVEPVDLARLTAAREVFLTSSIRGRHPTRLATL